MSRALRLDGSGWGTQEIADSETLNIGNIAPLVGNLTLGGAAGSNVYLAASQNLNISGATGGINLTGGADVLAAAGSTLAGFDSIEGILSSNLVDKSATEVITGQWTFNAGAATNPKLIVKANGAEAPDSLLFQVQNSVGGNLFSVDIDGDVVIAGGETVAGATVFTGDITLGDGGNTVQLGSGAAPAVGDNVYINTTGTVDGNFSITTSYFNVDTAGNLDMGGNVLVVNSDAVAATSEYSGVVWLDGDGATNVEGWRFREDGSSQEFVLQYKQNPTDASDLTEAWTDILTAGPTSVTIDAATFNANTGNFTTINGTFSGTIAACGTSCNAWEINNDALGATPENTGVMFPAGDGANLQNFQLYNNSALARMVLRYKVNPTDPADMAEAGYTNIMLATSSLVTVPVNVDATSGLDVTGAALTVDANGIDCGGGIDLNGTLSFDGVAASIIDTSGNNALSINVGTSTLTTTAGLVDLRTSTTALDVPSGTAFRIGGVALTTANFTAPNIDTLLNGSNADALHTHAIGTAGQVVVSGIDTSGTSQYYATYISANNVASSTDVSSGSGSFMTASFAGVCEAAPAVGGALVTNGKVEVQFEAALTIAAGDPALLSWSTAGKFTNDASGAPGGTYITRVGTVLDTTSYGSNQRCEIIIHAQSPAKK